MRHLMSYCDGMKNETLTVGQLADAGGVTRRAIRFYVQRGLLEPPDGKGRAAIYGQKHLNRLNRIQSMQVAGHSLDAIATLLKQQVDGTDRADRPSPRKTHQSVARAGVGRIKTQLWSRLLLAEGIELNVDATRHSLSVEQLMALRDAVKKIIDSQ